MVEKQVLLNIIGTKVTLGQSGIFSTIDEQTNSPNKVTHIHMFDLRERQHH